MPALRLFMSVKHCPGRQTNCSNCCIQSFTACWVRFSWSALSFHTLNWFLLVSSMPSSRAFKAPKISVFLNGKVAGICAQHNRRKRVANEFQKGYWAYCEDSMQQALSSKACLSTSVWKPSMHFSTAPLCFIWQSKSTKSCPADTIASSEIKCSPPLSAFYVNALK